MISCNIRKLFYILLALAISPMSIVFGQDGGTPTPDPAQPCIEQGIVDLGDSATSSDHMAMIRECIENHTDAEGTVSLVLELPNDQQIALMFLLQSLYGGTVDSQPIAPIMGGEPTATLTPTATVTASADDVITPGSAGYAGAFSVNNPTSINGVRLGQSFDIVLADGTITTWSFAGSISEFWLFRYDTISQQWSGYWPTELDEVTTSIIFVEQSQFAGQFTLGLATEEGQQQVQVTPIPTWTPSVTPSGTPPVFLATQTPVVVTQQSTVVVTQIVTAVPTLTNTPTAQTTVTVCNALTPVYQAVGCQTNMPVPATYTAIETFVDGTTYYIDPSFVDPDPGS